MKTLLRSSLLALLAIGAFAGVASQSTAKFTLNGACSKCAATSGAPTTTTTSSTIGK